LAYDEAAGRFTWLTGQWAGQIAGTVHMPGGYRKVFVAGRCHYEHRLVWFWVTGVWPEAQIDHINGNSSDNRIANLRPATQAQNNANRKRRETSRFPKGVKLDPRINLYVAHLRINRRCKYLGSFRTPEAAHDAYVAAARAYYGEFARAE
jgi:hypothetical protein